MVSTCCGATYNEEMQLCMSCKEHCWWVCEECDHEPSADDYIPWLLNSLPWSIEAVPHDQEMDWDENPEEYRLEIIKWGRWYIIWYYSKNNDMFLEVDTTTFPTGLHSCLIELLDNKHRIIDLDEKPLNYMKKVFTY